MVLCYIVYALYIFCYNVNILFNVYVISYILCYMYIYDPDRPAVLLYHYYYYQ